MEGIRYTGELLICRIEDTYVYWSNCDCNSLYSMRDSKSRLNIAESDQTHR